MGFQEIATFAVGGLALAWLAWRWLRRRRAGGNGCGCGERECPATRQMVEKIEKHVR